MAMKRQDRRRLVAEREAALTPAGLMSAVSARRKPGGKARPNARRAWKAKRLKPGMALPVTASTSNATYAPDTFRVSLAKFARGDRFGWGDGYGPDGTTPVQAAERSATEQWRARKAMAPGKNPGKAMKPAPARVVPGQERATPAERSGQYPKPSA